MSWFLSLSVKGKMILSFGLIIVINTIIAITTSYSYLISIDTTRRIEVIFSAANAKSLNALNALVDMDQLCVGFLAQQKSEPSKAAIEQFKQEVQRKAQIVIDNTNSINANSLGHLKPDAEYTQNVNTLKKEAIAYIDEIQRNTLSLLNKSREEALYHYLNDATDNFGNAWDLLKNIIQKQGNRAITLAKDGSDLTFFYIIIALNVISIILCIIIAITLTKYMTHQLNNQMIYLKKMADGQFDFDINTKYTDDFGLAIQEVSKTKDALVKALTMVRNGTYQNESILNNLLNKMTEVDNNSQSIQSQSLTVAAASDEMLSTTKDISANCELASSESENSKNITNEGVEYVKETIHGIQEQSEQTQKDARIIAELAKHSADISSIVNTIDEIAAQTNLLALNAAIEAARAGEAGRGFAVVADEVRALASRTAKSTQEISSKISNIQDMAQNATNSMGRSSEMMVTLTEQASSVENLLQNITNVVTDVNTQITQIAAASEEQTTATSEIASTIQNVTNSTADIGVSIKESIGLINENIASLKQVRDDLSFFILPK